MSETPAISPTADSFRFLGHYYDNAFNWMASGDSSSFQIKPSPLPRTQLILLNIIFIAFFSGFLYLGVRFGRPDDQLLILLSVIGIGVMTCSVYTGWMLYQFRRGDPWLVFDAKQKTVSLPREKRTFPVNVVRLQWLFLTGMQTGTNTMGGSELQLVARQPEKEETFLRLTSMFRPSGFRLKGAVFEPILRSVKQYTPIEIICVAMKDRNTPREQRPYEAT